MNNWSILQQPVAKSATTRCPIKAIARREFYRPGAISQGIHFQGLSASCFALPTQGLFGLVVSGVLQDEPRLGNRLLQGNLGGSGLTF